MKFTERSFDGSRMVDGDHTMRVENALYDGEKNNISIRAVAVGGESDGSFVLDYYNLARKNGEDQVPFGVVKIAALMNATGIEPDKDFEGKEEMNAYLAELEGRMNDQAKIPALLEKLNGMMFTGTVKTNAKSGYTNIVKYCNHGGAGNQGVKTSQPEQKKSW